MDYNKHLLAKWNLVCRTCLSEEYNLQSLFCEMNLGMPELTEMLSYCSILQAKEDDCFPQQICQKCVELLTSSFNFKRLCLKSDALLRQAMGLQDNNRYPMYGGGENFEVPMEHAEFITNETYLIASNNESDFKEEVLNNVKQIETGNLFETVRCNVKTENIMNEDEGSNDIRYENDKSFSESDEEHLKKTPRKTKVVKGDIKKCKKVKKRQRISTDESKNVEKRIYIQQKSRNKLRVMYLCEECDKTYESPKKLAEHKKSILHLQTIVGPNVKVCRHCRAQFTDIDQYEAHKKTHGQTICTKCGKLFAHKYSLKKHMVLHTNKKEFLCTDCGKGFAIKSALKSHMVTHTKEKKYCCNICGKYFTLPENLYTHKRIHTGERRYACEYCNQKFIHWSSMKSHIRTYHTKEKKKICTICGKAFSQTNGLTWHMLGHTGEKPFPCTMCEKRFKSSSCLKKHMVTHTGERNHPCTVCHKMFSTKYTVTIHMRTHTGEQCHACSICGRAFSQAHVLRGHMKTHPEHQQTHMEATVSSNENEGAILGVASDLNTA